MAREIIHPATRRAQWRAAFASATGALLFSTVDPRDMHMIETAKWERNRPWQFMAADYEVRPRRKGVWGIYLRKFNICLAEFSPNSAALRDCLSRCFDAAYANKKIAVAKFRELKGI